MNKLFRVLVVLLLAVGFTLVGCEGKTKAKPNTLHVTSAQLCASPDISGTFEGKEYSLTASTKGRPLGVACYDPIRPEDVGKDFHAELDKQNGYLIVTIPDSAANTNPLHITGTVNYEIGVVKEIAK